MPEPAIKHLDANGVELHVGDVVQLGRASGHVLILENWPAVGGKPATAGVYCSNLGTWGDCRAVEASRVTKIADADPELERLRAKVAELIAHDRADEQAHRAAVRTGDAAVAGRTASRWSATRAELTAAQVEFRQAQRRAVEA